MMGRPQLGLASVLFFCACGGENDSASDDSAANMIPCDPSAMPEAPNVAPSGVSRCTPVADLTVEEMSAWCAWYGEVFDGAAMPSDGPAPDGVVVGGAFAGCGGPVCIQGLSQLHCMANLEISDCTLPVGAIEDCVRSIVSECGPVGDGCGPFLQSVGCDTTIVQHVDGSATFCPVPIE
jgi:hypothetical protein